MLAVYLQGFFLGAAMILPLGPQNMFVMNQGIRRQYHWMIAGFCACSDALLIGGGIFGGSALLLQSEWLLQGITWAGVAFLLWYGWGAFRSALRPEGVPQGLTFTQQGRWAILGMLMAVTWLNPHVYLDTFVVLGSLGGQMEAASRPWFATGAISASIVWFFSLAGLAAWLSPWLRSVAVQRGINIVVALVMWAVALQLAWHSIG